MFDKCTARCTSLASLKPNWSQPYIIGGRVCALETFPKIVAALPSAAEHAALIPLPILMTVDGDACTCSPERGCAPQIGFGCFGGGGWVGEWRAAGTGCSYSTGTHVCPT